MHPLNDAGLIVEAVVCVPIASGTIWSPTAASRIWHGRLLSDEASSRANRKTKIPLLFYKQLAFSGLSGDALLYEA